MFGELKSRKHLTLKIKMSPIPLDYFSPDSLWSEAMCCPVHGSGDLSLSRRSRAWPASFCLVWFGYVGWLALVLGIQVCRQAGIEVICT